jgi:hypothetical protein
VVDILLANSRRSMAGVARSGSGSISVSETIIAFGSRSDVNGERVVGPAPGTRARAPKRTMALTGRRQARPSDCVRIAPANGAAAASSVGSRRN